MGNQETSPHGNRVTATLCCLEIVYNANVFRLETLTLSSVSSQVKGQTVIFESVMNFSH